MTKSKWGSIWAASSEEQAATKDRQSSKHSKSSGVDKPSADHPQQDQEATPQHNTDDTQHVITRSKARRAVPTLPSPPPPPPPPPPAEAAAGMAEADIARDLASQPSTNTQPSSYPPQAAQHQQQVDHAVAVTDHTPERPAHKRRQRLYAAATASGGAAGGGEGDDITDGGEGTCKYPKLDRTLSAAPEKHPRQDQQQQQEEEENQGSGLLQQQQQQQQHNLPQDDDLLQQQQPNTVGMVPVTNNDGKSFGTAAHQQDYPGRKVVVQGSVSQYFILNEKNIKSGLSIPRRLVRLQFGQPTQLVPLLLKVVVNDQPVALRVPQPQVRIGVYQGTKSVKCLVFGGHHAGLLDYIGYQIDKWRISNAAELTIYLEGPVETETPHGPAAAPPAAAAAGESISADWPHQQQQAIDHLISQAAAKGRRTSNSTNGQEVAGGGAPCTYVSSSLVLSEGNLQSGLCIAKALVEDQFTSVPVLIRLRIMLDGALIELPHGPGAPPAVRIVKVYGNCYQVRCCHRLGLLQYIGHRLIGYSCSDGGTLVMHLQTPSAAAEETVDLATAVAAAAAAGGGAAAAAVDSSGWLGYGDAAAARAAEDSVAEPSWWAHVYMHTRNGSILQRCHKSELRIPLKLFRNAFDRQHSAGLNMLMSVWQDGVRVGGPLPCKMHDSDCLVNPPMPLITQVLGCTLHKLRAAQPHFLQVHVSSPSTDRSAAADVGAGHPAVDGDVQQGAAAAAAAGIDAVDNAVDGDVQQAAAAEAEADIDAVDNANDGDVQQAAAADIGAVVNANDGDVQAAADSDCSSDWDILPMVAAAADADGIDAATDVEVQQPATGSDLRLEPDMLAASTAAGAATSALAAGITVAAAAAPTSAPQAAPAPALAAEAAALAGRDLTPCSDQQQRQPRQQRYAAAPPRAAVEETSGRLTTAARLHLLQQQQERQDCVGNRNNGQAPGAATSAAVSAAAAAAVVVVAGESAATGGGSSTGIRDHPAAAAAAEVPDRRRPASAAAAGPAFIVTAQHIPAAAAPADSCPLLVGYRLPDFVSISDAEDHLCALLSVDNLRCPDEQLDRLQEAAATLSRLPAGHEKLLRFRKDYRYVQEWVRRQNVGKLAAAVDKMLDSALKEAGT